MRRSTSTHGQRYLLHVDGRDYEVELSGALRREIMARVDGVEVIRRTTSDERTTLRLPDDESLLVLRTSTGRVRRITLHTGAEELDLDPAPGSPDARRLERRRAHPALWGAVDVLRAACLVALPLLGLGALAGRLVDPFVNWLVDLLAPPVTWLLGLLPEVDLPSIPLPDIDLPDIPWPSIDWSWMPDWTPPAWLVWALDHANLVKPVVLAAFFAWWEHRRRRRQDERKAALARKPATTRASEDEARPEPTAQAR